MILMHALFEDGVTGLGDSGDEFIARSFVSSNEGIGNNVWWDVDGTGATVTLQKH